MTRRIRLTATVVGGLVALAALVALAGPVAGQEQATLTGSLAACYVGQDLTNEEHLACADLCMELAVPFVLVAEDGHVYVPTDVKGDRLSRHASDLVGIEGTTGEQASCRTVAVSKIGRAKAPEPEGSQTGSGKAYTSRTIDADDLAGLRNISLYEFLRQHAHTRIDNYPGVGEVILCEELDMTARGGAMRGCGIYLNQRRVTDPLATARDMLIHDIARMEILRRSEASNRYGGHGFNGLIVIHTKR